MVVVLLLVVLVLVVVVVDYGEHLMMHLHGFERVQRLALGHELAVLEVERGGRLGFCTSGRI